MNNIKRPVPLNGDWYNKNISDLIYIWLQCHVYKGKDKKGEDMYFVYISKSLNRQIANETKRDIRTVRARLRKLEEYNFIKRTKVLNKEGSKYMEVYELPSVGQYHKIGKDTLNYLINTTNDDVIKVYSYLLYKCNNVNYNYLFSIKEIVEEVLGLNYSKDSNREKAKDLLDMLIKIGLLKLTDKRIRVDTAKGFTSYLRVEEIKEKVERESVLVTKKMNNY